MKKIHYILGLALFAALASCTTSRNYAQPAYYQDDYRGGVTYQQFYDELSPYGNWINYPGHGYVWSPYEAGFAPYATNGHWVYSTYGWTWVSNYRWGWAPFHYGRWFNDARYGWLWLPGYEWAPAWVAWRGGGGYYGWAPLGPGMNINVSINMIPRNYWSFVPGRYINHRNVHRYYVHNPTTIIHNTTVINNNYYYNDRKSGYNAGPPVREIERVTNSRIAPVRVVDRSSPGTSDINNDRLAIYRPQVSQSADASVRPSRVSATTDAGERQAPSRTADGRTDSWLQDNGVRQPADRTASPSAVNQNRPERVVPQNNPPAQRPAQVPANDSRQGREANAPERNVRPAQPVNIAPPRQNVTGEREAVRPVSPRSESRPQQIEQPVERRVQPAAPATRVQPPASRTQEMPSRPTQSRVAERPAPASAQGARQAAPQRQSPARQTESAESRRAPVRRL